MVTYGLPNLSYAVLTLPLALFVPSFYADDLALPLAGVGAAITISRLFDVITDPLIGVLSDLSHTRFGRRKPWVAAGAPLLMLSAWMIFAPSGEVSVAYLLGWSCLLFLAFTLVDLPYKAWGAELSTDYAERSRVTAWREGFGFLGHTLLFAMLMVMGVLGYEGGRDQLLAIALAIVLSLPPLLALALWTVPERPPEELSGEWLGGWQGLSLVFHNPAFLRMVGAVLFFVSGLMIQATLHRLVLTHVTQRPDLFAIMILIENIVTLATVPIWMWISDRIGKHRALTFAALWVGVFSLALPFVARGEGWSLVGLIVVRGSSFAPILFLSNSIAADVVDYDTLASGRQRTGLYFAVWTMTIKLSIALGVLLGTVLPAAFGFEPSDATHTVHAEFALLAVYGWVPGVMMTLGAPFLWNFPITQERQRELRYQIAARFLRKRH
jgi:Na+/melibiose symporter and related transporters